MPNQPRAGNRGHYVLIDDELWAAAQIAAAHYNTTRSEVMRDGLRVVVERYEKEVGR